MRGQTKRILKKNVCEIQNSMEQMSRSGESSFTGPVSSVKSCGERINEADWKTSQDKVAWVIMHPWLNCLRSQFGNKWPARDWRIWWCYYNKKFSVHCLGVCSEFTIARFWKWQSLSNEASLSAEVTMNPVKLLLLQKKQIVMDWFSKILTLISRSMPSSQTYQVEGIQWWKCVVANFGCQRQTVMWCRTSFKFIIYLTLGKLWNE